MTNSKNTKRALLASVLSVVLCCAMLVGSTFAWFTDSVTNTGNKIVAGNLKVDLIHVNGGRANEDGIVEGSDVSLKAHPNHKIFDYDLWEPGYTVMETLRVVNEGNLALKFRLDAVAAGATAATTGEKLADVIDVYVYEGEEIPTTASFADLAADNNWRNAGSLSALMADQDGIAYGVLLPDEATAENGEPVGSVQMTVALHMQEEAGNAYQGLTLSDLNFTLNATQYTYEEDGFDNQYDKDATYGNFKEFGTDGETMTADEFQEALNNGKWENMAFKSDVTIDKEVKLENDAVLDFGGNTINGSAKNIYQGGTLIQIGDAPSFDDRDKRTTVDATIDNANFVYDSAYQNGGTLINVRSTTNLTIKNSTFTSITSGLSSSSTDTAVNIAVNPEEKNVIVFENCVFKNCRVRVYDNSYATGDGNYELIFRNCSFEAALPNAKGAVQLDKLTYNNPNQLSGTVTVENCRFDIKIREHQSSAFGISVETGNDSSTHTVDITVKDSTFMGHGIMTVGFLCYPKMFRATENVTFTEEGTNIYQRTYGGTVENTTYNGEPVTD